MQLWELLKAAWVHISNVDNWPAPGSGRHPEADATIANSVYQMVELVKQLHANFSHNLSEHSVKAVRKQVIF